MENLTGKQLGPYQVVAALGEGGMAAVYKAFHPGMDRYVAIKVLPQQLAADPEFVGRFKHEAQVLAKLQHPHILPVFDFGESDGYTYIVMPLVESGTLTTLLMGGRLPLNQIRDIAAQVGDALDYAHSLGLIHRDVKPSNVLIDKRGNCTLTDFGIAKMVQGSTRFTSTGGIVGTPDYMSPEQGRGGKVDHRTDIYALGIMLYEMVTGRVPFQAETPIAVVFKHISDPLPLPSTLNPATPVSLEIVILKALAKNPDDRFATAGDMVRALKTALPDSTVWDLPPTPPASPSASTQAAPPPRPATPLPSPVASQPKAVAAQPDKKGSPLWLIAGGGVLLLVLCAALVVGAFSLRRFLRLGGGQASENSITVTSAAVSENQLNTIAAYTVEVSYTLEADNGVVEVWMDGFTDPGCLIPDTNVGTNETIYYNAVPIEKGSDTVVLEFSGALTTAKYLSVNARLSDETISNNFAQDADHLPCIENTVASSSNAFTKTPPVIDGAAAPGEWDAAILVTEQPNFNLYYLNDSDTLYLLLDVVGDTGNDRVLARVRNVDFFQLAVDVNGNSQIDADTDINYGIADDTFGQQRFLGPGSFTGLLVTSSKVRPGFGSTTASLAAHRFWEFGLSLVELEAAPGGTVRLGVQVSSVRPEFLDEVPLGFQNDFSNLLEIRLGQ